MTHIDEYRLELLVLDPEALGSSIGEINAHLEQCAGCALMVKQIQTFYRQVEETYERAEPPQRIPHQSLVLHGDRTPDIHAPISTFPARRWTQERGMIRSIARRHPILSGSGAFTLLAGALAGIVLLTRGPSDTNPAYAHLNPAQQKLEVYNAENQELWVLPAENIEDALSKERTGMSVVRVVDLDGDGRNEVVSIIRSSGDPSEEGTPLRVFNDKGGERFALKLGAAVTFAGADYGESYVPRGVEISAPGPDRQREIYVGASTQRSPYVINRVSASGLVLGEYWHFGSIYGMLGFASRGKPMLLAWGTNDLPDTSGHDDRSFAMITLLDPTRLVGKTESVCTRGFGLPPSDAESHYIRLPRSDIQDALALPAATTAFARERDSVLTFITPFASRSVGDCAFFFSFSRDLSPLYVKSNDITEAMHRELVAEGRLNSRWTRSYLDSLKAHIEFLR